MVQHPIAGRLDDGGVERPVGVHHGAVIVVVRGFPHHVDEVGELRQRRVVDAAGRRERRHPFERRANGIDLEEILGRDLPHLRAAERGADDEAEQLEIAQRFANRAPG